MGDRERLVDILEFGRVAVEYVDECPSLNEVQTRLAVERALYLIGEAANHLSPATMKRIDQPWRHIVALRQVLAHRYEEVSPARLVEIVVQWVPGLLKAVDDYSS